MLTVYSSHPFLSRMILFLMLPFGLIFAAIWFWLSESVAVKEGIIQDETLGSEVKISFTANMVPHIHAKDELDAYFALGFVHAQNRLWQMDMNRRLAKGELSAVLGKESLSADIFMRMIGLKQIAQQALLALNDWELEIVRSYTQGVNSGIKKLKVHPPEYFISQTEPEPWREIDTLALMQLFAFQLSSNFRDELMRGALIGEYGLQKANELMPPVPHKEVILDSKITKAIYDFLPQQTNFMAPAIGSNAWVVSGSLTQNGKVILANDPHLSNSIPSVFYLARVKGGDLDVEGASFPGLPFIAIGRNKRIAWGVTASMVDNQDLFVEEVNPSNVNQYLLDGSYRDMSLRKESIDIKPGFLLDKKDTYQLVVRETTNGPIISDVIGQQAATVSFCWAGKNENGGSLRSFLKLNYARNWNEFNAAFADHVAPVNAIVFGDSSGNIGLLVPGAIPIRGLAGEGYMPGRGGSSEQHWQGYLPPKEWYSVFNPAEGYLVTSNNNIFSENYPVYLTYDWASSLRYQRIRQQLASTDIDKAYVKKLQNDVTEPLFAAFKEYINLAGISPKEHELIEEVLTWDGDMQADSLAATKFAILMANIYQTALSDDIALADSPSSGRSSLMNIYSQANIRFMELFFSGVEVSWCDDVSTTQQESCVDTFRVAIDKTEKEVKRKIEGMFVDKNWGDIHQIHFPHFPYSKAAFRPFFPAAKDTIWSSFFHREDRGKGGVNSINIGTYDLRQDNKYQQFSGAVYRQVTEPGIDGEGFYILNTGQSGNMFSKHYDDQINHYINGLYVKMNDQEYVSSIILTPN